MEHESEGDINCNWYSWYCHRKIGTRIEGLENKRTIGDHPNYSIIEIGQNTGDLRFAVTENPVKNYQLTLV